MVSPNGLPFESMLVPTAAKSPVGVATTQSPRNVPETGLTERCHRSAPPAVYDVTAKLRAKAGPDTTATLPEPSAAILAACPALSLPAERPPAVHSTGSVVAATTGLAVNG